MGMADALPKNRALSANNTFFRHCLFTLSKGNFIPQIAKNANKYFSRTSLKEYGASRGHSPALLAPPIPQGNGVKNPTGARFFLDSLFNNAARSSYP